MGVGWRVWVCEWVGLVGVGGLSWWVDWVGVCDWIGLVGVAFGFIETDLSI